MTAFAPQTAVAGQVPAHRAATGSAPLLARYSAAPAAALRVIPGPRPAPSTVIARGSAQAMQRRMRQALLARQAAAIEPLLSRSQAAAVPVLRAEAARAGSARAAAKQPEMAAAAADWARA
jgi:hypothetical protein